MRGARGRGLVRCGGSFEERSLAGWLARRLDQEKRKGVSDSLNSSERHHERTGTT